MGFVGLGGIEGFRGVYRDIELIRGAKRGQRWAKTGCRGD